jgi:hypothetical protein
MREACLFSGYCWGSCPPMLVFEVLKRVRRTVSHVRFWRAVRHRYDGQFKVLRRNGGVEPEKRVRRRVGLAGPICGVGMRPAVCVPLVSEYLVHFYLMYYEAP